MSHDKNISVTEGLSKDDIDALDRFAGCLGFMTGMSRNKVMVDYLKRRNIDPELLELFHNTGIEIAKAFLTPPVKEK